MKRHGRIVSLVALFAAGAASAALGQSPPSPISYQGQLKLDGLSVDESCDYVFRLYDADQGGILVAQVGDEAAPVTLDVQKGLFTATLDFGAGAFSGPPRWLEVSVRRTADAGPYQVLAPRQLVTAAPYALHALSGGDTTSLDQAYNNGGPGAGRTMHLDSGALSLEGPGGLYVEGSVGIGVQDPQTTLDVNGLIRSAQGGFQFPDGTIQTTAAVDGGPRASASCIDARDGTPADALCVDDEGDVGIAYPSGGTDDFPFNLDVNGTLRTVADAFFETSANVGPGSAAMGVHVGDDLFAQLVLESDPNDTALVPGITTILMGTGAGGGALLSDITVDSSVAGDPLQLNSLVSNDIVLASGGGNVGIGVNPPLARLHVSGSLRLDGVPAVDGITFPDATVQTTAATGDITAVLTPAGSGLTGSATSGDVTLNVDFGGSGAATTVSRSDHTHDGADVVSGTVGEPFIDALLARDAEVFPIVLAADGSGSTLDADLLDGLDSTDFASASGVPGGQTIFGGTMAGDDLTLESTSDPTKGFVLLNPNGGDPAGGSVGIGTTTPTEALHVVGNALVTGDVLTHVVNGNSPLELQTDGVTRIYIDDNANNGHVGVGNLPPIPPLFPLDVNGDIHTNDTVFADQQMSIGNPTPLFPFEIQAGQAVARLISTLSANGSVVELRNVVGAPTFLGAINFNNLANTTPGQISYTPANDMFFVTANAIRMHIDGAGDVGIGVTPPDARLHVAGGADLVGGTTGGFVQIGDTTSINVALDSNEVQARNNGVVSPLHLNSNGGNVIVGAAVGGNLGIGNINPASTFDVLDAQAAARLTSNSSVNGSRLELRNDTANPDIVGAIDFNTALDDFLGQIAYLGDNQMTFRVNGADRIRIASSGNVGIGSPPPDPATEALEVNGCIKADCLKIPNALVLDVAALSAVRSGTSIDLLPQSSGTVKVRPLATGTQNVMIAVQTPTTLLGTGVRLDKVRVCYKVSSPSSFITATRVRVLADNGTSLNLIDDATDQKSAAWTCYEAFPGGGPVPLAGPIFIHLELSIGGATPAHDIEIGRVTVTFSEAP